MKPLTTQPNYDFYKETPSGKYEMPESDEDLTAVYPEQYASKNACLHLVRKVEKELLYIPLCNFAPFVRAEITYDDGAEPKKILRIMGYDQYERLLPAVDVPADELDRMKWLNNRWPASCSTRVFGSVDKHLVCAIKGSAEFAEQQYIFAQTGWKKIGGVYHYLLPGNSKYDVQLTGKQQHYGTVEAFDPKDTLYTVGLMTGTIIPKEVILPCLSVVFLSPLNEFLRMVGHEPKFILTLIGHTGSKKSTVAALMLSYFGQFSATDLPMSFRDTANSIEYNAFTLKDVLGVVDDYHPTTSREGDGMRATMQSLARGYGDRAFRARLTPNIQLRPSRPPMGNLMVTAEFQPDITESGTARLFCVEMPKDGIDLDLLTQVQTEARRGVLQRTMFGYIEWLKREYLSTEESVKAFAESLEEQYLRLRDGWQAELRKAGYVSHARLPDNLASLCIGYETLLAFLKSVGQFTEEGVAKLYEEYRTLLFGLAVAQIRTNMADKPSHVFVCKLMSLIDCGQVSLLPAQGYTEILPSNVIGYEDETYYYLSLEMTHKSVRRLCQEQNESFLLSSHALSKVLADEGLIEVGTDGKHTRTCRFGNKSRRVMLLRKSEVKKIMDTYA